MMGTRDNRVDFKMESEVSDGTFVFAGTVLNVSRKGIKMVDVPKKFDFYSAKCIAVMNGTGKSFKLFIKPRWSKTQGQVKEIGFQIISPPLNWIKFINEQDGREEALSAVLH